jgi:ribosomal protein L21
VWHAIIEVGGAQQIVSEGRFYSCHSLPQVQAGQKIVFERVLATKQPGSNALKVGHPYVQGARVHATVLENYKDKKIIVFKMKAKKHYRRKAGHRQHMSRFLVTKVEFGN